VFIIATYCGCCFGCLVTLWINFAMSVFFVACRYWCLCWITSGQLVIQQRFHYMPGATTTKPSHLHVDFVCVLGHVFKTQLGWIKGDSVWLELGHWVFSGLQTQSETLAFLVSQTWLTFELKHITSSSLDLRLLDSDLNYISSALLIPRLLTTEFGLLRLHNCMSQFLIKNLYT
jgi:hypothetical protein